MKLKWVLTMDFFKIGFSVNGGRDNKVLVKILNSQQELLIFLKDFFFLRLFQKRLQ